MVIGNIFSGLVIGFILGIALQRGRFCFNSAFQDTLRLKDYTIIKALDVMDQMNHKKIISIFLNEFIKLYILKIWIVYK